MSAEAAPRPLFSRALTVNTTVPVSASADFRTTSDANAIDTGPSFTVRSAFQRSWSIVSVSAAPGRHGTTRGTSISTSQTASRGWSTSKTFSTFMTTSCDLLTARRSARSVTVTSSSPRNSELQCRPPRGSQSLSVAALAARMVASLSRCPTNAASAQGERTGVADTAPSPTRHQVQMPASSVKTAAQTEASAKSPARSLNSTKALPHPPADPGNERPRSRRARAPWSSSPRRTKPRETRARPRATARRSQHPTCGPAAAARRSRRRARATRRSCPERGSAGGRSAAARRQRPHARPRGALLKHRVASGAADRIAPSPRLT